MIIGLYVGYNGEQLFHCFWLCFFIYHNASKYDNTLFSFTVFSCLKLLYFLHSTLLLSLYIDVVLTLSNSCCTYIDLCWSGKGKGFVETRRDGYHYSDVIMSAMASQITSLTSVYPTVYSNADQRKYQSSASLAFVRLIQRWPVNTPHKGPLTRKMFPFDGVFVDSCKRLQFSNAISR